MARAKRPWGVVAGPFILVAGMAVFWGARSAMAMKEQVIDWSYQFEHSSEPVTMQMPDVPLVPPLFINSNKLGRINMVVVQRDRPGAVDSITILAEVPSRFYRRLERCNLRLRVNSIDWSGYTHALRCAEDTDGMLSFGHLNVIGSDISVPIRIRVEDLPCNSSMAKGHECSRTAERLRRELRQIQRDVARDAREQAQHAREEAQRVREQAQQVREQAQQVREHAQQVREQVRREVRAAVRSNR